MKAFNGRCIYIDFLWCDNDYSCDKCPYFDPDYGNENSSQSIEPKQLSIFDKDKTYNILINERDYGKNQFLKKIRRRNE